MTRSQCSTPRLQRRIGRAVTHTHSGQGSSALCVCQFHGCRLIQSSDTVWQLDEPTSMKLTVTQTRGTQYPYINGSGPQHFLGLSDDDAIRRKGCGLSTNFREKSTKSPNSVELEWIPYYTFEGVKWFSRPMHLNAHIVFDPGMVMKGVLWHFTWRHCATFHGLSFTTSTWQAVSGKDKQDRTKISMNIEAFFFSYSQSKRSWWELAGYSSMQTRRNWPG